MKKIIFLFVLMLSMAAFNNKAKASHAAGVELSLSCLGNNQYLVTLSFFRDCSGISAPAGPEQVDFTSPCGNTTVNIPLDTMYEVSQICDLQIGNTTCQNGSLPGIERYIYEGVVTLSPCPAGNWVGSWSLNARNPNNNTNGGNLYIETTINTNVTPCNNLPVFTADPIPYYCAGSPVNFNPGVVEPDGDSLDFYFGMPLTNANQPIVYTGGYSNTNPFPVPVTINNQTGQISFNPTAAMTSFPNPFWVLKFCVDEYRNGVLIGTTCRDIQFSILPAANCGNTPPYMLDPGIQNFSGSGTQIDSNSIQACYGQSFSFDIQFADSLLPTQLFGDSVELTTNALSVFPNLTITTSTNAPVGDTATMHFSGTVPVGAPPFNVFTIFASDNACPLSGIASVQFDITAIPSTNTGPDDTLCGFLDTLFLNPIGGDTFTWEVLSGDSMIMGQNFSDTTGTDGGNVWVKPTNQTTYKVTSNLPGSCQNTDTITVSVRQIDLGPDTMLCRGDTLTLGATGTVPCGSGTPVYSWSPTTGLDNPSSPNPVLTVGSSQQTTTYQLIYDDGCGCQTVDSMTVEVSDVEVQSLAWNNPNCLDSTASITLTEQGGFPPYQYSLDSLTGYQASNQFNNLPIGYYNGYVQDSLGCISPAAYDTIIDPGVELDSAKLSDVTCFGAQNGEIEVFASSGATPYTYSIDSGMTFQGSQTFPGLNPDTFNIVIEDNNGCRTLSQEAIIETNSELFVDSIISENLNCFEDYTGSIDVYAHGGTPPLEYSIDNGNTWSQFGSFDSLLADNYVVIVRDSFQCETAPQVINLTQPSKIDINLTVENDTCFQACGGQASATVSGGVMPYAFDWNGYGSNNSTSWNLCSGPAYVLEITDDNNCVADTTFTISEPDELVIDSIAERDLECNGNNNGQIQIFASGGRVPYYYSIDGGQSFQSSNNFTGLTAGTYNVVVRDSAYRCQVLGEASLIEPSPVEVSVPFNEKTICVSNCINLSAFASGGTGSQYNFVWTGASSNGQVVTVCPGQDTSYAVYAEDENGCASNVEVFEISIRDSLDVELEDEVNICPGEEAFISAIGSGGSGSGYRYTWSPITGLSGGVGQSVTASPQSSTTYTVELTDDCGSPSVTDTIRVSVNPLPQVDWSARDTLEGCAPYTNLLTNQTQNAQSVSWKIGEEITASGFTAEIIDLPAGQYDVTMEVTTTDGCVDSKTIKNYFNVIQNPIAEFSMTPNPTTIFNTMIQFQDQSTDDVVEWDWDFASLGSSQEQSPVFQMPVEGDSGTYPITLTVENAEGCTDEVTNTLRVGAEFNLYVPNSFTPNGDGLNDIFKAEAIGVNPDRFSMIIFNRWGEVVFQSNTLDIGWRGTVNGGNPAPAGSYVWKITANDITDERDFKEQTGYINLIR
ncbi:T9SS type B sorting domain-containing protein [Salibacter halophilus]|uniref:T9SS type B sorting domain-containing protein n=1 Tax=Salibacter halophilus TaxID=1803916 RepID=A0A6N6M4M3_9FLAO|nr:gliding motility-associated C-terminal domain-containing protein [Salibacter halophilus]KAB1063189.1 T9SS type B sorting domain-containing protein [Salibacter halophilus]